MFSFVQAIHAFQSNNFCSIRFLGSEDITNFFSRAQRSRIVFEILCTTPFGREKKGEVGVRSLVDQGAFSAAFPLHDVSSFIKLACQLQSWWLLIYWLSPRQGDYIDIICNQLHIIYDIWYIIYNISYIGFHHGRATIGGRQDGVLLTTNWMPGRFSTSSGQGINFFLQKLPVWFQVGKVVQVSTTRSHTRILWGEDSNLLCMARSVLK